MEKLSVSEIAKALNVKNSNDTLVECVCIDTRKILKGCLFIAIKGENFDGHDFIDEAFNLGAAAVISSKHIDDEDDRIIVVNDTKKALLDLAKYYKKRFDVFTVGVTGSVGKTSTKEMIYAVLNVKGKTLKTEGNFNNEIGMPLTMFNLDKSYKNAVFEMGMSSFGEIDALSDIAKPDIGVITNIGISHIENLKSRENILKAKLEIKNHMHTDAPLVLNLDDDMLKTVNADIEHPIIYYSATQKTDVYATNIKSINGHTDFTINYYGKNIDVSIPTIGIHNVYNALAAFCVGLVCDLSPQKIKEGLANYRNVSLRQSVSKIKGMTIIADCYNASPDSMKAAIDVIKNTECSGKRVCVFGDMLELGDFSEKAHEEVGLSVARADIDILFCYGKEAKGIKRGAKLAGMKNIYHFEDKEELAKEILKTVNPGDCIIFKASRSIRLEEVIDILNRE